MGTGGVEGDSEHQLSAVGGNWYCRREGLGIWAGHTRPRIMRPWEERLASQNGAPGGPGGETSGPGQKRLFPSCLWHAQTLANVIGEIQYTALKRLLFTLEGGK